MHVKLTTTTQSALEAWLQQHAGQLLPLQLCSDHTAKLFTSFSQWHYPYLRLPLDRLKQHLQLSRFKPLLPDEAGGDAGQQLGSPTPQQHRQPCCRPPQHIGTCQALPRLQQLEFVQIKSISSLLQLTHAPQLTSLVLECLLTLRPSS